MKTAIAISAMMRNVLSVAKIPPATVTASQTASIAPMIVPMIRPMYLVCASSPADGGRAGRIGQGRPCGLPGISGRDGAWPQAVTCLVGVWHVMTTAGLRDVKVNENRPIWSPNLGVFA